MAKTPDLDDVIKEQQKLAELERLAQHTPGTSNELFYIDENGQKQDANIHNWLLENGQGEPKSVIRKRAMDKYGISETLARALFG